MSRLLLVFLCVALYSEVICEKRDTKIVQTSQGPVKGYKDNEENIYTFFGIPYATAPTGPDRYKAPLPGPSWLTPFDADNENIICPQATVEEFKAPFVLKDKHENCLITNVYVPDTTEKNLPVLVIVHGGGFQFGSGNTIKPKKFVANHNIVAVTFNYRLGIHGFLCLGTEYAPGNAGMKDQVALLRWVKRNIAKFGGNPNDITVSGYSAGSASVDLMMLSPMTKGLFNKVIAESGGSLGTFAIQIDPLESARGFARTYNIGNLDDINSLEEFYKSASFETITSDSFFYEKNSSFVFSPCVENDVGQEMFLTDGPYNILQSGNFQKLPLLVGFTDREGLIRFPLYKKWKNDMNEKFSDFLPADLQFGSDEEKEEVAKEIKELYFGNKEVGDDTVLSFIDYFSDIIFVHPILRAVDFYVNAGNDNVYLYLYNYVHELTPVIEHTDLKGASHCAQTYAVLDDDFALNRTEIDLPDDYKKHKATMRQLWSNFIKTGAPVPEGSSLPPWPPTGVDMSPHMLLGQTMELRGNVLPERIRKWYAIFARHYRPPIRPQAFSHSSRNEL